MDYRLEKDLPDINAGAIETKKFWRKKFNLDDDVFEDTKWFTLFSPLPIYKKGQVVTYRDKHEIKYIRFQHYCEGNMNIFWGNWIQCCGDEEYESWFSSENIIGVIKQYIIDCNCHKCCHKCCHKY